LGTKIILFPGSSQSNYPYSIGINLSSLWNSIPSGNSYDWYINGAIDMTLTETFLNVNGDIRENNVNLTNKYLTLSGGTITGNLDITNVINQINPCNISL
jgi:hypothetical protein